MVLRFSDSVHPRAPNVSASGSAESRGGRRGGRRTGHRHSTAPLTHLTWLVGGQLVQGGSPPRRAARGAGQEGQGHGGSGSCTFSCVGPRAVAPCSLLSIEVNPRAPSSSDDKLAVRVKWGLYAPSFASRHSSCSGLRPVSASAQSWASAEIAMTVVGASRPSSSSCAV